MTFYSNDEYLERFERRMRKAADKIIDGPMCRKNATAVTREAVCAILHKLVEDEINRWRGSAPGDDDE